MTVRVAHSVAELGSAWDALFAAAGDVGCSRPWFAATEDAALPPGAVPRYLQLMQGGVPCALLPMLAGPGARMQSLTTPYTVHYQPLLAHGMDARAAGAALGRALRRSAVVRLEALDPEWPALGPFEAGLRDAGLVVRRFGHFGNWQAEVAGLDWNAYLAARPGPLRSTIHRRVRACVRDPAIRMEVRRDASVLAAYEAVYASSWKEPEPFPRFNAALLPRLAAAGALRMGVMWRGAVPVAAQYWTVWQGVATVLKLAHDEAAGKLSPGTVLTAHVIAALLAEGGLRVLDFGRGDDPYKQAWTDRRRQRIGMEIVNSRHPAGWLALARARLGALRRGLRAG